MTTDKARKTAARQLAAATGQSYTAALREVPASPPAARPFVVGDRVRAGWLMLGCDMEWWEGEGAITDISPADEYDGQALPPLAFIDWDQLVPMPCTHDHWHEGPTELRGAVIPLTADRTASAHPRVKRIELVEQPSPDRPE
jgi:hypothetical protein